MKKKSLLILPVLLLALAACNKEEEEEVPADDTTTPTEPTEPTEPGDQGGDDDGEDEGKVAESEKRIDLTVGSVILNPTEVEGVETGVEYANPESGLYIADVVKDENGDITYYLDGTPSTITDSTQAEDFWSGHAAQGDKYIVLTVKFEEDEIVSWTSSAGDLRARTDEQYPDGYFEVVTRISGEGVSADKLAGTATYTVTNPAEKTCVNHTVDFSKLITVVPETGESGSTGESESKTGITLTTGEIDGNNDTSIKFKNPDDSALTLSEGVVDENGDVVYTLSGTPSEMCEAQANDFWSGHAKAGDKYVIITVTFAEDEIVSWTSSAGDLRARTVEKYPECSFDVVLRISGDDLSDEIKGGTSTYTITNPAEKTCVNYTVDFSALIADSGDGGQA